MTSKDDLLKMIQNDPLGILDVKAIVQANTVDERLINNFHEINTFIDEFGHKPQGNPINIIEHQLYVRLSAIKKDENKVLALKEYDKHNLLAEEIIKISSIEDILNNDILGILSDPAENIFNLKHVSSSANLPDYVARRKPLKEKDFEKYKELFGQCHEELRSGKRILAKFIYSHIKPKRFFVLAGVLLYVDKIGKLTIDARGISDGRTRLIFENGTYSAMKYRSLGKALTLDGKTVTTTDEEDMQNYGMVAYSDDEIGYLYVLRSLSTDPYINQIENLYKIGFTTTAVNVRVKDAENETTYLMAPVKVVMDMKFPSKAIQKLEKLIHSFFHNACIDIKITDKQGSEHIVREWFTVPLAVIEQFLCLISDNAPISDYYYDIHTKTIRGID